MPSAPINDGNAGCVAHPFECLVRRRRLKMQDNQPTLTDLHNAWTAAIEAEGIGGAQAETRQKLQEMRNRKTTWVGDSENKLRYALDEYLSA